MDELRKFPPGFLVPPSWPAEGQVPPLHDVATLIPRVDSSFVIPILFGDDATCAMSGTANTFEGWKGGPASMGDTTRKLMQTLFIIFADKQLGTPTLSFYFGPGKRNVKLAKNAASYIQSVYGGYGKERPQDELDRSLKKWIKYNEYFSMETFVRIKHCVEGKQNGWLCLCSEEGARWAVANMRKGDDGGHGGGGGGRDDEAEEAEEDDDDEAEEGGRGRGKGKKRPPLSQDEMIAMWNITFDPMLRELCKLDGSNWYDEYGLMREAHAPQQVEELEAWEEIPGAPGDDDEANPAREFGDTGEDAGGSLRRSIRVRRERVRRNVTKPAFDQYASFLGSRRPAPGMTDITDKMGCAWQRLTRRDGVTTACMLLRVWVCDPMWSTEQGCEAIISEKEAREADVASNSANKARGKTSRNARDERYPDAVNAEASRIVTGSDGVASQHPIYTLTKEMVHLFVSHLTIYGQADAERMGEKRMLPLSKPGNPWAFKFAACYANVAKWVDKKLQGDVIIPPDLDWSPDGVKVDGIYVWPHSLTRPADAWMVPLSKMPLWNASTRNLHERRHFPWYKPMVASFDPDTYAITWEPLEAMHAPGSSSSTAKMYSLETVAAQYGLNLDLVDEHATAVIMRGQILNPGNGDWIPPELAAFTARNGSPIVVMSTLNTPIIENFAAAMNVYGCDKNESEACQNYRDLGGGPWRSSEEYCRHYKRYRDQEMARLKQVLTSIHMPDEYKDTMRWRETYENSPEGLPGTNMALFNTDPDAVMGYSDQLKEFMAMMAEIMKIPGGPCTFLLKCTVFWHSLFVGCDRIHIYEVGVPGCGKSHANKLIAMTMCPGLYKEVDSASLRADTDGRARYGVESYDEAPPALHRKKERMSAADEEMMAYLKTLLTKGEIVRKVLELVEVPGRRPVRITVRYRTPSYCPYSWLSNFPVVEAAFCARVFALTKPLTPAEVAAIQAYAAQRANSDTQQQTYKWDWHNQWLFSATAVLCAMIDAKVVHPPVSNAASAYFLRLMQYMRGVGITSDNNSRLSYMFTQTLRVEHVRWVINCAFRVPGVVPECYMKPPTIERLAHAWSLLGYYSVEMVMALWPMICTQFIKDVEIKYVDAMKTIILPKQVVASIKGFKYGISAHLILNSIHGTTSVAPYHTGNPYQDTRLLPERVASDATDDDDDDVIVSRLDSGTGDASGPAGFSGALAAAQRAPGPTLVLNGGTLGQSGGRQRVSGPDDPAESGVRPPVLVGLLTQMGMSAPTYGQRAPRNYGYLDTGMTIFELGARINAEMPSRAAVPEGGIMVFLDALSKQTMPMVDCILTDTDWDGLVKRMKRATAGGAYIPDIDKWLSRQIRYLAGSVRNYPLMIRDPKTKHVSVAISLFKANNSDVITDAMWSIIHEGMKLPPKIVITKEHDPGRCFGTVTFGKEDVDRMAKKHGPFIFTDTRNMNRDGAMAVRAHTSSVQSHLASAPEGMDPQMHAFGSFLEDIVATSGDASRFRPADELPPAFKLPNGKPGDPTEADARQCWNLHGQVGPEPLTPALISKRHADWMARMCATNPKYAAALAKITEPYPGNIIRSRVLGDGMRDSFDSEAAVRASEELHSFLWKAPGVNKLARQSSMAPVGVVGRGGTIDDLKEQEIRRAMGGYTAEDYHGIEETYEEDEDDGEADAPPSPGREGVFEPLGRARVSVAVPQRGATGEESQCDPWEEDEDADVMMDPIDARQGRDPREFADEHQGDDFYEYNGTSGVGYGDDEDDGTGATGYGEDLLRPFRAFEKPRHTSVASTPTRKEKKKRASNPKKPKRKGKKKGEKDAPSKTKGAVRFDLDADAVQAAPEKRQRQRPGPADGHDEETVVAG